MSRAVSTSVHLPRFGPLFARLPERSDTRPRTGSWTRDAGPLFANVHGAVAVGLSHADEHRPKRPVLIAVDKEMGDEIIDAPGNRGAAGGSMTDTERHDCQPPSAETIGQIWTGPVCGNWLASRGRFTYRRRRLHLGSERACKRRAAQADSAGPSLAAMAGREALTRCFEPSGYLLDAEEVRGSNPLAPTSKGPSQRAFLFERSRRHWRLRAKKLTKS
jgi:hypothetical protein